MSPPLRSALLLVACALGGGAVFGAVYGLRAGLVTAAVLALVDVVVLAGAHALVRRRRALGSLRRQFAVGVAVAVGLAVSGAVVAAVAMFVSPHDALLMAVLTVTSGAVALQAGALMTGSVLDDVEAVRRGVAAVGAGSRAATIRTGGSDELATLAADANRMIERLATEERQREQTESARRELVAAVSHDLRTPLTSLQLLADAVEDGLVDDATRRQYLARMGVHTRALGALVDDLFELSRLEAGEIAWSMETVQLGPLVGDTVEAMRPQADAKGVTVAWDPACGETAATANPEQLQRVLFNLIQNAIRHTPADGSVTVRAQPDGAEVEIEVADTGEGVPAGDRDRVFEPFARGDQAAARTRDGDAQGTGLGLAICRAIVEAHGGRIWLTDGGGGHGTAVRIRIPRAA